MNIVKEIYKKLHFVRNIPKTLYVNFTALPFHQAKHLPIYCGNRVSIKGLSKGSIVINGPIKRGMIHIGLNPPRGSGLGGKKYKDMSLFFGNKSKIVFQGKGGFGAGNSVFLSKDAELILGEDFSTNVLCSFFVYKKVVFGDDCFCGWNVSVRDGDGHYIISKDSGEILNHPEEIHIGNHVWLCSDVTVMKGISIADDCVVACNSLVLKSLSESHAIYGGSPAKLIKENVSFIRDGRDYG